MRANWTICLLSLVFVFISLSFTTPEESLREENSIHWYTWAEAQEANEKVRKNFLIDIYSDRCVWCMSVDSTKFQSPETIEYINKNFYPIKFNAEKEATVVWKGESYPLLKSKYRNMNLLAYMMLKGERIYPSMILLNGQYQRINTLKGYYDSDEILQALEYVVEAGYKKMDWRTYKANLSVAVSEK